jgi:hypothetical protein
MGACYECTLSEQALRDLSVRYSCPLLARQNILLGKVPTTPTIASIIGAMQSQEALKLINGMPVQPGKVTHFNGMVNEMHTTAYAPRQDCESHWTYGQITELPARAERTTLADLLRIARADLGPDALIELDQELITALTCPNGHSDGKVLRPTAPRVENSVSPLSLTPSPARRISCTGRCPVWECRRSISSRPTMGWSTASMS